MVSDDDTIRWKRRNRNRSIRESIRDSTIIARERERERGGDGSTIIRVRDACISAGRHLSSPLSVRDFEKRTRGIGESRSGSRAKQRQRHAQGLNSDENRSSLLI